jgi:TP901-1 family phage major tail protein
MATINANTVALYIDVAGGSTGSPADDVSAAPALKPVAYSTSASISVSNATYEATSITAAGSGATTRDYAVGSTATSMSVEGVLDWTVTAGTLDINALFDAFAAKTEITAIWQSTASGKAFGGLGFLTSFELSSGVDDFATYSASLELSGDPVKID